MPKQPVSRFSISGIKVWRLETTWKETRDIERCRTDNHYYSLPLLTLVLTKACDLCYKKRIRCDAQKPRCSHCVVYESECTYVCVSRKTTLRKKQKGKEEEALQLRVKDLETQLKLLSREVESLKSHTPIDQTIEVLPSITEAEGVSPTGGSSHNATKNLPPLREVLSMVERYLATFNSVFPIFHPATLLDMVKKWYQHPKNRDPVTWAAINVVLALALRLEHPDKQNSVGSITEHVNNARSVLTEVVMGDTALINVQVLVGLVLLFQGARDLWPPTVLIATALRLAHRLGLHTRRSSARLDACVALQRSRVFWMAYILDRDLSMRTRQAPVQLEADIDLDLPADEPDDDHAGYVFKANSRSKMNVFRARVQLARIQGRVYDYLYSEQARNSSAEERTHNMESIRAMLEVWSAQVPSDFSPSVLLDESALRLSRFFCVLYSTRLICLFLISHTHSWNSKWVNRLQDYGRKAAAGETIPTTLLPPGWQTLVDESRSFMSLFMSIPQKDSAVIW